MSNKSLLIVVSAPSGAGKTTLCDRLMEQHGDIVYSVSCTTRAPRGDEQDGKDYFFMTDADFLRRVETGAFLEYARVHAHYYGTLRETVINALGADRSILMDIDVQGARQIRDKIPDADPEDPLKAAFVDIFIEPPSIEELKRRLENRAEDAEETIRRRVQNAEKEMADRDLYRYRIVNADLETAYTEFEQIILKEQAEP